MKWIVIVIPIIILSSCGYNKVIDKNEQIVNEKLTTVFFDHDSAKLDNKAKKIIKDNAAVISKKDDYEFVIQSHTDPIGEKGFNKKLAAQRAEAVKAELLKNGVSSNKLTVKNVGKKNPLVSPKNSEHADVNRRVEIKSSKIIILDIENHVGNRAGRRL